MHRAAPRRARRRGRRRRVGPADLLLRRLRRRRLEDDRRRASPGATSRTASSTTAAIGAMAVSDSDPNVIYAGTGETAIRGNVSHGDGVYKSTDGGRTWAQRRAARYPPHRQDPDPSPRIRTSSTSRRSATPGGRTRSAASSARSDGGADLGAGALRRAPRRLPRPLDGPAQPAHPLRRDLAGAALPARARLSGGEECGICRSTDGGDTWTEITRKPGLPTGLLGQDRRRRLACAAPGRVWALIEAEDGALFRSDDCGETWDAPERESLLRTRALVLHAHHRRPAGPRHRLRARTTACWKSIDGGATFTQMPTPHGDDHALWIDPHDNQRMIEGNDGGACVSFNGGATWSTHPQPADRAALPRHHRQRVPLSRLRLAAGQHRDQRPEPTTDGAIHERSWFEPGGGESGYIAIKPDEPLARRRVGADRPPAPTTTS